MTYQRGIVEKAVFYFKYPDGKTKVFEYDADPEFPLQAMLFTDQYLVEPGKSSFNVSKDDFTRNPAMTIVAGGICSQVCKSAAHHEPPPPLPALPPSPDSAPPASPGKDPPPQE